MREGCVERGQLANANSQMEIPVLQRPCLGGKKKKSIIVDK